jgi:hypothetical protein
MRAAFAALFMAALALPGTLVLADTIWSEGFETDGMGTRYTTNATSSVFHDGTADYWGRESNSSTDRSYTGGEATYWWGGQDQDDDGGSDERTILFTNINISGYTSLKLRTLFASDSDATTGFDSVDYIHVQYRINGGNWQDLLWFENLGETYNDPLAVDGDFDGVGDPAGRQLTAAFQEFTNSISGSGSVLDIQVEAHADTGGDEWAMDNLRVTGVAGIDAPTANAASATNAVDFTASWTPVGGATGYELDVAANSAFTLSGSDTVVEGFESWAPTDWTLTSVDQSTTYAHTYTNSAKLGAAGDKLITPLLAKPGTLTFWSYTTSADPGIVIEQSSSTSGPWAEVTESPFSEDTGQWNQRSVDLSTLEGIYVRFRKTGSGTLYVDDVDITDLGLGDFVSGYESKPIAGGATTSASVTGLDIETTYYYRVRATNSTVVSINSNTQTVQTTTLLAPTALAATATSHVSFTAAWTTVNGATGYTLDVATNNAFAPSVSGDIILSELCDPNNSNARTNRYIEIYNAGIQSVDLTGWSVVAVGNGSDIFTWNLSGTIAPGDALTCGDAANTGFTPDFASNSWSDSNSSWNGDTDDGVKLKNGGGSVVDEASTHGDFSDGVSVRHSDIGNDNASFAASEWTRTAVADVGIGDSTPGTHTCDYPDYAAGDYVLGYESRDVGNATECDVTGLTDTTVYYYRVRAYDANMTSANSNTESVETLVKPEPSNHPGGLAVGTVTHRTIILTWTDSVGANEADGYLVLGSTNGYDAIVTPTDGSSVANDDDFSDGTYANKIAAGEQTDELKGLTAEQSYYFKVFAYANAFSSIDYKIDGDVPPVATTTGVAPLEDAEDVSLGSYTTGSVALDSGNWFFTDTLIGITDSDKRADQKSLRINANGSVAMEFDLEGAKLFFVEHANYGSDTGGKFRLYSSTDDGGHWTQAGDEVICGATLEEVVFLVHELDVRFKIEQTAGIRINIDNVRVTDYIPTGTMFLFR